MASSTIMASVKHNEPLVKIPDDDGGGFSVSPIANTREYHEAFERMPLPSTISNAAYEQAGRILQKTTGKNEEYLVAIDAKTGELVADNLSREGKAGSSTFEGAELDALNLHRGTVITIHNHPHSLPPSFNDVITASQNRMIAGSIILGHDGSVWYIACASTKAASVLKRAYNALKDAHGEKAEVIALSNMVKRSKKEGLTWMQLR